jgi:hypothetical protein
LTVLDNGVLRRISGAKMEAVTKGWRKLLNEKLHNLYYSPYFITIIKSRRLWWKCMWHALKR